MTFLNQSDTEEKRPVGIFINLVTSLSPTMSNVVVTDEKVDQNVVAVIVTEFKKSY